MTTREFYIFADGYAHGYAEALNMLRRDAQTLIETRAPDAAVASMIRAAFDALDLGTTLFGPETAPHAYSPIETEEAWEVWSVKYANGWVASEGKSA